MDPMGGEHADVERSLLSSFQDEANYEGQGGDESDLEPPFADEERRQMTPRSAVFSLLASMLGGGMLTLPYATSKVGIGASLIISFLCAAGSEATYWFLIESARATKRASYQSMGEEMFGVTGRIVSMVSLVLLTLFASMGYLLLLGLLIGELFAKSGEVPSRMEKNLISISFAVILAPLSSSKSLHALRYANALSVMAAVFLLISVVFESSRQGEGFHPARRRRADEEILWFTDDPLDIIYAIPFYVGAYMAHFSLLSVHSELISPTRERLKGVLRKTVFSAWVLYSAIGVIGYMYAMDSTCDSIFSNLPRDWLTVMGRLGLVATLALSYPLFIVPCRSTICDLIERRNAGSKEWLARDGTRRGLTAVLVTCSAILACIVPSAAVFVSLTGSSVGTVLSLILPSMFYLKLTSDRRSTLYTIIAPVLILTGFGVLIFSTWMALDHATDDPCDAQKR